MKKTLLLLSASFMMTFASCTKEAIAPVVVKTQTELLLHNGASWKLTAATVDPALPVGGTLITNYYAQLDACDKDETYLYSANPITATTGSVVIDNSVKCNSSEQSKYAGTWSFNSDGSLTTSYGTSSSTEKVLSLTESKFVTAQVIPIGGINYTITLTYQ
jgi:Lipocalin-like domain